MINTLHQVCSNLNESDHDLAEPHLGNNIPTELNEVSIKIVRLLTSPDLVCIYLKVLD